MPNAQSQSATQWKLGLALLATAIVACTVYSFIVAARRVGRVVDPDYYSHGLHYGQSRSSNPGRDWTLSASLSGGELRVNVADRSGAPVPGGRLVFESDPLRGTPASPLQLAESAPGTFHCPRPSVVGGELHGTLRYIRGEASASQKLVVID